MLKKIQEIIENTVINKKVGEIDDIINEFQRQQEAAFSNTMEEVKRIVRESASIGQTTIIVRADNA